MDKIKKYVNMKEYKGYYKTIIDGEEVMVKDFDEHYQLEVSGYKKKKMNLYLWKDKRVIVGKMFDVINLDTMEKYEKILIQECIEKGNELYINFKNTHIEITKQKEE